MSWHRLLLGILCVWRLTHLLAAEDGPGRILARLRRRAGSGFWGTLLDCFHCLSLWVAVPFAWLLGEGWRERLLLWLALSGAAILTERLFVRLAPPARAEAAAGDEAAARDETAPAPPALWSEDPEDNHGLLRKAERGAEKLGR